MTLVLQQRPFSRTTVAVAHSMVYILSQVGPIIISSHCNVHASLYRVGTGWPAESGRCKTTLCVVALIVEPISAGLRQLVLAVLSRNLL